MLVIIWLLIVESIVLINANCSNSIDLVIEQLSQRWRPHQIVMFTNDTASVSTEENCIFQTLTHHLPIKIISLTNKAPLLESRSSTIYIVIHTLEMYNQSMYILGKS